jgi:hypothetical protein
VQAALAATAPFTAKVDVEYRTALKGKVIRAIVPMPGPEGKAALERTLGRRVPHYRELPDTVAQAVPAPAPEPDPEPDPDPPPPPGAAAACPLDHLPRLRPGAGPDIVLTDEELGGLEGDAAQAALPPPALGQAQLADTAGAEGVGGGDFPAAGPPGRNAASGSEVNAALGKRLTEALPAIDLAHADLPGGEQGPKQHGCGLG